MSVDKPQNPPERSDRTSSGPGKTSRAIGLALAIGGQLLATAGCGGPAGRPAKCYEADQVEPVDLAGNLENGSGPDIFEQPVRMKSGLDPRCWAIPLHAQLVMDVVTYPTGDTHRPRNARFVIGSPRPLITPEEPVVLSGAVESSVTYFPVATGVQGTDRLGNYFASEMTDLRAAQRGE